MLLENEKYKCACRKYLNSKYVWMHFNIAENIVWNH